MECEFLNVFNKDIFSKFKCLLNEKTCRIYKSHESLINVCTQASAKRPINIPTALSNMRYNCKCISQLQKTVA